MFFYHFHIIGHSKIVLQMDIKAKKNVLVIKECSKSHSTGKIFI